MLRVKFDRSHNKRLELTTTRSHMRKCIGSCQHTSAGIRSAEQPPHLLRINICQTQLIVGLVPLGQKERNKIFTFSLILFRTTKEDGIVRLTAF